MGLLPTEFLLRPRELHPNVVSPETYLSQQFMAITSRIQTFPNLRHTKPYVYVGQVMLVVHHSTWQLQCMCGNYPVYDPEWELAACYSCGAIFHQAPPGDWKEIQRVLINRPELATRNMLAGQTLKELRAENREHGDPD